MDSGNNQDSLTAAHIDNTTVIRVEGRGSFKISPSLKQFIHQVIDRQSARHIILIDMSNCLGMDSTFMGVLAGLSCHIKSKPEIQFKLINLSEKNQKLLKTLGVDRVLDYSLSVTSEEKDLMKHLSADTQTLEPHLTDKLEAAKTTLEAHETLVEINPNNYSKFKSVLEFLKEDVHTLRHKKK